MALKIPRHCLLVLLIKVGWRREELLEVKVGG
jgi:hypothetical protein